MISLANWSTCGEQFWKLYFVVCTLEWSQTAQQKYFKDKRHKRKQYFVMGKKISLEQKISTYTAYKWKREERHLLNLNNSGQHELGIFEAFQIVQTQNYQTVTVFSIEWVLQFLHFLNIYVCAYMHTHKYIFRKIYTSVSQNSLPLQADTSEV